MLSAVSQICWGILPIYWKLLIRYPVYEIYAHRMLWCCVFAVLLIVLTGRIKASKTELQMIFSDPRKIAGVIGATIFINSNWFLYIWAVNNNHVIDASLGFYIGPLISVLLAIVFLREHIPRLQTVAFLLALLGVINMIWQLGQLPWISLFLATSFAAYGLLKKTIHLHAVVGLWLETIVGCIAGLIAIIYMQRIGIGHFEFGSGAGFLFIGAGIVTAVPLMLFTQSVKYLPLKVVGFIQYFSPSIQLFLGVYLYHETFTSSHLISFIFIWAGLILFSWSQSKTTLIVQPDK